MLSSKTKREISYINLIFNIAEWLDHSNEIRSPVQIAFLSMCRGFLFYINSS